MEEMTQAAQGAEMRDRRSRVWVGVDWGTHSSKWAYFRAEALNDPVVGPIHSSNLVRVGENLVFSPTGEDLGNVRSIHSLKKRIIADPAGAFWDGVRDDTQTTLGEAVAFSLCNLLAEIKFYLMRDAIEFDSANPLDVGFSLPNWVEENDEAQRVALNHFHQAVMVTLDIFVRLGLEDLPHPENSFPIRRWREIVREAIARRQMTEPAEWDQESGGISVKNLIRKDVYDFGVLKCSYIVESCAAGLPYLRAMGDPRSEVSPRIRKLLVVDVGAGSTDIGYMLRTVSLSNEWVMNYGSPPKFVEGKLLAEAWGSRPFREAQKVAFLQVFSGRGSGHQKLPRSWTMSESQTLAESLNYFTPGNTHGIAGDDLTQRIRRQLRQQGRTLGFDEAQAEKERGTGHDWQVTKGWIQAIARHAADYIAGVQDTLRLPQEPPLEIILTGGSGPSIPGLAAAIRVQVRDALRARGIGAIAERTQIADVVLPEYGLPDAVAYARSIVSLGAADPEKPKLRHKERLEALEPGPRRLDTWRGSGG